MQTLNPHLRRWALPPTPTSQFLRVPVHTGEDFVAALDKIPVSERLTFHEHKVSSGESLGAIARTYGVSVSDIQKVNRIDNPNKIYVGMQLVIPTEGNVSGLVSVAGSGTTETKTRQVTHVVNTGEALSTIATRYGVKQADLMRWNGIDNAHRIYAGQKLKLYEPATRWKNYTVSNGDNLSAIAARNNCSVSDLKSWNNLRTTRIYPGQKLKIRRK
jgi:membrane-bound lytic murein transglycosylase D